MSLCLPIDCVVRKCKEDVETPESTIEFATEKTNPDICLLRESPFRILRLAECGNAKEFERMVSSDSSKLYVRNSVGRGPIHQAAIKNHLNIVQIIIAYDGDVDLQDNTGNTSVHLCVEYDALEVLEYLLLSGADARILNEKLQTPLHLASDLNKPESLKILSRFPESHDPNQPGEQGRTALHLCCIHDHDECLKILLYDMGASPRITCKHGFFAIHESAKHASSRSMELLLSWGELNGCKREEMISFFDSEGNVPLHSAVHGGDIKAVQLCLRSGAKISTQQHDLSTPVHLAASQGALNIVELMFNMQPEEKDICLKSCDLQRMTPLMCAAVFDHYALVDYLVSEGAQLNSLNKDRRSALLLSASRNAWCTMKTLIRLGADLTVKDKDKRNVLHTLVLHDGELEKVLDHETSPLFIPILEDQDKKGMTALHYACKRGHIKSVEKLLSLKSSILTKNNEGQNALHISCAHGRLNIIQQILKSQPNSIVNEADGIGMTALHIAASHGHIRVLQCLMKKGALLHRCHRGQTPLHLAGANGHREAMKLILTIHSFLIDQTDKDGNTALHTASMHNQPNACELLLKLDAHLLYNFNGYSAIDFAIQSKFTEVVNVMVNHPQRGDEVLNLTLGKYSSIMLSLVATMPTVANNVLNRCIISSQKSDSEFYYVKYDFKWLSLVPEPIEESKVKVKSSKDEGGKGGKKIPPNQRHLPILNGMVSHGRVELLSHDLSQKYLQMKWNSYGKYFQLVNLVLYVLYLSIITMFTTSSYTKDSAYYNNNRVQNTNINLNLNTNKVLESSRNGNFSNYNCSSNSSGSVNCPFPSPSRLVIELEGLGGGEVRVEDSETFLNILIFAVSLFNIVRECVNILRHRMLYTFNFENFLWWTLNISSVCMIILPRIIKQPLQNPLASLSAFLSWFYLLVFLQRFEAVGIYVVMFLEILHTLLRVLMIFSILIIAFSLAFYILLSNGKHIAFENFPMSLMRTLAMMLGDLDFVNSFLYPRHCYLLDLRGKPQKILDSSDECELPQRVMSFFMLALYIILMPILLMNMIIGLAVGDIESVRANAQLKRLTMQVELHTSLEKSLPAFLLRRIEDKKEMIEYPNQSKVHLGLFDFERLFQFFTPKSHGTNSKEDSKRPEKTMEDLVTSCQETNTNLSALSFEVDNLKTIVPLIRQICHKLEISTDTDFIDEGSQLEEASLMSDLRGRFKRGVTVRRTKRLPPQRSDSDVF